MRASQILETALYAEDLATAEAFYSGVLGLELLKKAEGRHLFYRLGAGTDHGQMLLIFNPHATTSPAASASPYAPPPHGSKGAGHLCFRAGADELAGWRAHLRKKGVEIEAEISWPAGGRSLYIRDPAGNSLEFAEPLIWEL